jgi:hypothetical protein
MRLKKQTLYFGYSIDFFYARPPDMRGGQLSDTMLARPGKSGGLDCLFVVRRGTVSLLAPHRWQAE